MRKIIFATLLVFVASGCRKTNLDPCSYGSKGARIEAWRMFAEKLTGKKVVGSVIRFDLQKEIDSRGIATFSDAETCEGTKAAWFKVESSTNPTWQWNITATEQLWMDSRKGSSGVDVVRFMRVQKV